MKKREYAYYCEVCGKVEWRDSMENKVRSFCQKSGWFIKIQRLYTKNGRPISRIVA